jgi:hypothetical protein
MKNCQKSGLATYSFLLCGILSAYSVLPLQAQTRNFPSDAVININSYGAYANDNTDDTAAIQNAISSNIGSGRVLYFPNGTYNISNTLIWKDNSGNWRCNIALQGQSRDGTILRLRDNASGFTSGSSPKPVIMTASQNPNVPGVGGGNQAFLNNLYDLTVHTGNGNHGAIGIDYLVNNQGVLKNVRVQSGDGNGVAGVSMRREWPGPGLLKNVTVTGFQYGIQLGHSVLSMTMEDVSISGQKTAGIYNNGNVLSIRKLTSNNTVPAIVNTGVTPWGPIADGFIVLLDSRLTGGSTANSAIRNEGHLLLRNVFTSGYKTNPLWNRGSEIAGPNYTEWCSSSTQSLFSSPSRTLGLAIEETPNYWNNELTQWQKVGPRLSGETDDTAAIQRAIDAGKPVVYFPVNRNPVVSNTVYVRGNVRQILGMGNEIKLTGGNFSDTANPRPVIRVDRTVGTVFIERLLFGYDTGAGSIAIQHNSARDLVLKQINIFLRGMTYQNVSSGNGRLFIEDVSSHMHSANRWVFNGQNVWARQFNVEANISPQVMNNGGKFWVLGYKTEDEATLIYTANGMTELLGGFHYNVRASVPNRPVYRNENSRVSLSFVIHTDHDPAAGGDYSTYVRETRGGVTNSLSRNQVIGRNGDASNWGRAMPLYVGYEGINGVSGVGTGLRAQYYDNADLTSLRTTRLDDRVNFDWGTSSPAGTAVSDGDTFSVRWTGAIQPRYTDRYTFYLSRDNGARLWINGALVIDQWNDSWTGQNGRGPEQVSINLLGGQRYPVILEYFESTGGANCRLEWQSNSQAREVVPSSQLYPQSEYSVANATYRLIARHSGRALDVAGGTQETGDRTNVHQWDYEGAANQQWIVTDLNNGYFKLKAVHSGKCLDVNDASPTPGANVQQYTDNGGTAQQWYLEPRGDGYFSLLSRCSGETQALDVNQDPATNGGVNGYANGANVQQFTYYGNEMQQWRLDLLWY